MTNMEIAKTILDQLGWQGQAVIWSWGARDYAAMNEQERFGDQMLGGLKFKVSGARYKGSVIVWLVANDTYTVEFGHFSRKKMEFVTKDKIENVYCDELAVRIDERVESGSPAASVAG